MELIDKQATIDWLKKVTVTEVITFEAGFKQIIYDIEQMPCVEVRPEKEMTIGEAIAHLEDLQRMYLVNEKYKADVKALDVAIKALERKDVLDKIKAEIEQDAFKGVDGVKYTYIPRVNRIIDKYKAESEEQGMIKSEAVSLLMNSQYYEQGYKQGVSDVLDKIRAEIENFTYYCWEDSPRTVIDDVFSPRTVLDDVLEIIDKYKAESEG